MIRRLILPSLVVATASVFVLRDAVAELPACTLTSISPSGGQAGTEVEVTVAGQDMDDANALFFGAPGFTAKLTKPNTFSVKIAADVPVGIYDLRVIGRLGVSNPRAFAVGDQKELTQTKPADKRDAAIELAPGTVFNGSTTSGASDYFKFAGKKGERILIECSGSELDSRIVPVVSVLDATGKEIESSPSGGLLDFTPKVDGQFFIQLHDISYSGANAKERSAQSVAGPTEYPYRLKLGKGPRLDFILPPGGQPATKGKFTLYGRGLPGGTPADLIASDKKPLEKLEVTIDLPAAPGTPRGAGIVPASVTVDGFFYRLKTPGGTSNPVFIGFAADSLILEKEPNNNAAQAQKISIPCEIGGQFYPAADNDIFVFDAKKGDIYWVEVISNRIGVPSSPFFVIQRDGAAPKGVQDISEAYASEVDPGGKRFVAASYDPASRFEVKEDGAYRIQVRDLFGGTRNDPAITYRISIHKESPDFRLAAMAEIPSTKKDDPTAGPRGSLIRGGETLAIKVLAFRRDNFTGEIELSAEGLPEGVTAAPSKIEANKTEGILFLTASEKAATAVAAIKIVGKAISGASEIRREARNGATLWPVRDIAGTPVRSRLASEFVIAVSGEETASVSVQPAENKVWEAPVGGKLDIPLTIVRRNEFAEPLKLKAGGIALLDPLKELDVDAKATAATFSIDLKSVKLPAGTYSFYLSTLTKVKFAAQDAKKDPKKDPKKEAKKEAEMSLYSAPIRIAIK